MFSSPLSVSRSVSVSSFSSSDFLSSTESLIDRMIVEAQEYLAKTPNQPSASASASASSSTSPSPPPSVGALLSLHSLLESRHKAELELNCQAEISELKAESERIQSELTAEKLRNESIQRELASLEFSAAGSLEALQALEDKSRKIAEEKERRIGELEGQLDRIRREKNEMWEERQREREIAGQWQGKIEEIRGKLAESERLWEEEKREKSRSMEALRASQQQQQIQQHRMALMEENVKERDKEAANLRSAMVQLEEQMDRAKHKVKQGKVQIALVILIGVFYVVLERMIEQIMQAQSEAYG